MPIEVNVEDVPISVSASGTEVQATVSGGIGPQGPQGPPGEPAVLEAHAATHAAAGSDPITVSASQISGGSLPANAVLDFSNGTSDSEIGGWGFGVELTENAGVYATVEPSAVTVHGASGYAALQSQGVYLSNGTSLAVGTFDSGRAGYNGLSLVCAVGYELNWQAGYLKCLNVNGTTRTIACESPIEFPGEGEANVTIDATGITFADESVQTSAFTGDWADITSGVPAAIADGYFAVDDDDFLCLRSLDQSKSIKVETNAGGYGGLSLYAIEFTNGETSLGEQTTPWLGSVDWDDVDNKPALFDGAYSSLTGTPSTFTPSAHNQAWSTITSTPTTLSGYGITDGVTTSDSRLTDARTPTSHAHGNLSNAGLVNGNTASGQIVVTTTGGALTTAATIAASTQVSGLGGAATLNVGTTAGTVAAGDHTHTQLHDRSHAITSTSDHTAGNWKVLYTNGSGQVVELGLGSSGQALLSNGASAAPSWGSAGSNSASDLTSGTLAYARMADPTVTSPSQIAASQNDYASFARGINRFSTNAARDITGMVAGNDGEVRVLCNTGTTAANTLTIKDESASSSAANRFSVPWNGDCVIPAEGSVVVFYDGTSSRWRVV